MQVGDIISIDNTDHLEIVSRFDSTFIWVKPLQYDVHYERYYHVNRCGIANDEQICNNISEWVKFAYINNIESQI